MQAQKDLRKKANKKIADHSQRFFKTGPGEYAHGDLFLGVRVPEIRKLAQKHLTIDLTQNSKLLKSKYHEERLLALLILVKKYEKAKSETDQEKIYRLYTKHFKYINNWDLVDCSSPRIVGKHLLKRDRKILYTWARSKHLWTRRISIMANWWFIREKDLKDVFKISRILLKDEHDLIHKAVNDKQTKPALLPVFDVVLHHGQLNGVFIQCVAGMKNLDDQTFGINFDLKSNLFVGVVPVGVFDDVGNGLVGSDGDLSRDRFVEPGDDRGVAFRDRTCADARCR